jgi:hypothetical protein
MQKAAMQKAAMQKAAMQRAAMQRAARSTERMVDLAVEKTDSMVLKVALVVATKAVKVVLAYWQVRAAEASWAIGSLTGQQIYPVRQW